MWTPPTGLLGVGLGGDNLPRMIALQVKVQFLSAPILRRFDKVHDTV